MNDWIRREWSRIKAVTSRVANLQEEEFGRSSVKKTALEKVVILGDNRVTICAGKIPDHRVIGMIETVGVHMLGPGKKIENLRHNPARQILVEEKLHAASVKSFLSRSAAKARQA
jgi:hypothetical protein